MVVFGCRGEVEFRWAGDGNLLWQTDLQASYISSAPLIDDHIVITGGGARSGVSSRSPRAR